MADDNKNPASITDSGTEGELPPGVKLLHTIEGHQDTVRYVTFDPQGKILASASDDHTVKLWDVLTGKQINTFAGHQNKVTSIDFDPTGRILASGSDDENVILWDVANCNQLRTLMGHNNWVLSVSFSPIEHILASGGRDQTIKLWNSNSGELITTLSGHSDWVRSVKFNCEGRLLASGSSDYTIKLWDTTQGTYLRSLEGHEHNVRSIAFDPTGLMLASGSRDKNIMIWEVDSGKLLRILEGHSKQVDAIAFSGDGRLLASKSGDGTIRVWSCDSWKLVAVIPEPTLQWDWIPSLAFHPILPLLATAGSAPGTSEQERCRQIHIYELDYDILLGQQTKSSTNYTSAKIVLVGDSGVGKTGLGWRLAHGEYKEHSSTHGQQFWLLNQLCKTRQDGTQCEAVLWDLAGQPDYRLIHALVLDDADLALLLFDPTRDGEPLSGIEFWLKHLKVGESNKTPTLLIAARSDRGTARLTQEELDAFCQQRGIKAYLSTSAKNDEGLDALIERMLGLMDWDAKPITTTTDTFKRTKDFVLGLKEDRDHQELILTPEALRQRLEQTDAQWQFTDAEMLTAVGHLENHGYVTRLKTSQGEPRILLAPELLNNLAASFVLEARRNAKGLGSLEEQKLLADEYPFPELATLAAAERDILLDSAAVLFLEHTVCFRETDPLNTHTYLVFPELINLKRPLDDDGKPVEDGVAYTASGAVENVYASLVVLMGNTQTFTRTNQWRNHARYEVGNGQVCGFRLEDERAGELDFVLYFGADAAAPVRMLFQGLFENFLARRNLTVRRLEPVICKKGHPLNRAVVREQLANGESVAFCGRCGDQVTLPKADQPIQLSQQQAKEVEANRRAADERSRFEQVLFRLKTYVTDQKIAAPECFISYAWGVPEHERWVEKRLATDLQKAGIKVLLDRWENSRIGSSIARFVERIEECGQIIVIGTPLYRQKAKNEASAQGSVVAAEWDLAGIRLLATEDQKRSVLPLLLDGEASESFPALLRGRVYGDFRGEEAYFTKAFDLILDLFDIRHEDHAMADLRETLHGRELR